MERLRGAIEAGADVAFFKWHQNEGGDEAVCREV